MSDVRPTVLFHNIPWWYRLAVRGVGTDQLLVIQIAKSHLLILRDVPPTSPLVRDFERRYGLGGDLFFPRFSGSFSADHFGFFGVLQKTKDEGSDAWVEYTAKIPAAATMTHEACAECGGTGRNPLFRGERCNYCSGLKKCMFHNWTDAYALQTSLLLMLMLLSSPPKDSLVNPGTCQVLTVEMRSSGGPSGSGIWGDISPLVVNLLRTLPMEQLRDLMYCIRNSMIKTYSTIIGAPVDSHSFQVNIERDGFYLQCPGNATSVCCQFRQHDLEDRGRGARFDPHNVDSVIQALTLLTGMFKLSELLQGLQVFSTYTTPR